MPAIPGAYIPNAHDVARHLILRRWIGTGCEFAALSLFIAMLAAFGAFG